VDIVFVVKNYSAKVQKVFYNVGILCRFSFFDDFDDGK